MPNRILRDGILSSERVARLSFAAEVFYRRIMSLVDDYGRYTADLRLLRSACYPLRVDQITLEQVGTWLAEVASREGLRPIDKPLIVLYEVDGKPYLELQNFCQQVRAKHSKCPPMPSSDSRCEQMPAAASNCGNMRTKTETESETETKTVSVDDIVERMYNRHPKLQNRPLVEMECMKLLREGGRELLERVERIHQGWCESEEWKREGGKYVVTLDRWLNDRAWVREANKPAAVRTMPVIRTPWLEGRQ